MITALGSLSGPGWGALAAMLLAAGVAVFGFLYFAGRDTTGVDAEDATAQAELNAAYDVEPTPDELERIESLRDLADGGRALLEQRLAESRANDEPSEWALSVLAGCRRAAELPLYVPQADREPAAVRATAVAADEAMRTGMTGFTLALTDERLAEMAARYELAQKSVASAIATVGGES